MKCHQIEPHLAGHALGALDVEERLRVEEHLESCSSCRDVLADYQAVSEELAFAIPPVQPPPRLRARLIATTASSPTRSGERERLRFWQGRRFQLAVLAFLLVFGVFNLNLLKQVNELRRAQADLLRQAQAYQAALALMGDPDVQVAVLEGEGVQGTLLFDPEGQIAVLTVQGLEALPEGQDYQLWLIQPDETRLSGGVFDADVETGFTSFVIHAPQALDSFVGVGVTIEPAGGSPGPTGQRVFRGKF